MSPVLILTITFIYGIIIGSFLNVCIYRIPLGEEVVKTRSHCMTCGYQLHWYDNIPIFSYLILRGRCRNCKTHIPAQYPIVETVNGILYVTIFWVNGFSVDSAVYCLLASALLVLSIIDLRTYEIPLGINVFILVLGLIHLAVHYKDWLTYVIGFLAVSLFLELLLIASGGRAIGGGDVKLMAAAGLLLGWKLIILAFILGCILGSIIHISRMKLSNAGRELAMGPYLSLGILLAVLWGDHLITWYIGLLT